MKSFKEFLNESEAEERVREKLALFEHELYKRIPGTNNSYRTDSANTNTMTLKHSHVYAKPKGQGRQLYSVNDNGSGHDGSSGVEVPASHADHFRSLGYDIALNNILESIDMEKLEVAEHELVVVSDSA